MTRCALLLMLTVNRSRGMRFCHGVTEKEVTRDLQQFTATIRAIDARHGS